MATFRVMRKGGPRRDNPEKHYWDEVGLKLIVSEFNGKPSYSIADGRTGELFSCFPIEKQQGQQNAATAGADDGPY